MKLTELSLRRLRQMLRDTIAAAGPNSLGADAIRRAIAIKRAEAKARGEGVST